MPEETKTKVKLRERNFISSFYTQQEAEELKKRPKCDNCGHRLTDDSLFDVDGVLLCWSCMAELYQRPAKLYEE
jgi:formylmethanofuran dehydrogenase subunit E